MFHPSIQQVYSTNFSFKNLFFCMHSTCQLLGIQSHMKGVDITWPRASAAGCSVNSVWIPETVPNVWKPLAWFTFLLNINEDNLFLHFPNKDPWDGERIHNVAEILAGSGGIKSLTIVLGLDLIIGSVSYKKGRVLWGPRCSRYRLSGQGHLCLIQPHRFSHGPRRLACSRPEKSSLAQTCSEILKVCSCYNWISKENWPSLSWN